MLHERRLVSVIFHRLRALMRNTLSSKRGIVTTSLWKQCHCIITERHSLNEFDIQDNNFYSLRILRDVFLSSFQHSLLFSVEHCWKRIFHNFKRRQEIHVRK